MAFALRLYRKQPGTVLAAVAGLALAIGLTTAVVSVVNATMYRRLTLPDAPLLRWVRSTETTPVASGVSLIRQFTYREFTQLAAQTDESRLAAVVSATASHEGHDEGLAAGVSTWFVSNGFFEIVGSPAASHGRLLGSADDTGTTRAPVVINHTYWRRTFGADPAIVGHTLTLGGRPFTVVGIAARGFDGPDYTPPAFWAPLAGYDRDWQDGAGIESEDNVRLLARLADPAAEMRARDELTALYTGLRSSSGGDPIANVAPLDLRRIDGPYAVGEAHAVSTVTFPLLGFVLLLGAGNVAGLLIANASARRAEIATRLMLGARRRRLIRQLVTEGLLLAVLSGVGAWLLAAWLAPVLMSLIPGPGRALDASPDWRALGFLVVAAALTGVLASLAPAVFGTGGRLHPASDSSTTASPRMRRLGSMVSGAQSALSIVLVLLAVLLTRAGGRAADVQAGLDVDRVLDVGGVGFNAPDDAVARTTKLDAAARLRMAPEIEGVALSRFSPFGGSRRILTVASREGTHRIHVKHVSPEFFDVLGIPLLKGAGFNGAEGESAADTAVIGENLARAFWPAEEPIGSTLDRLHPDLAGVRVVGVAREALYDLVDLSHPASAIYRPLVAEDYRLARFLVRTRGDAASSARDVQARLREVMPDSRTGATVLGDVLRRQVAVIRIPARFASIAAAAVLLLAIVGLYGLTAFRVRQRVREIGVRMALGASRTAVIRGLLRDGLRPVVVGLALGVGTAAVFAQLLAAILLGIPPHDPVSILGAAVLLMAAAAAAIFISAVRTAVLDPSVALRTE